MNAFATDYYVSAISGSDINNNNGLSQTTAFKTIQKAADKTNPGDNVYIMNGTYSPGSYNNQSLLNITRSGTSDKYIVYKALEGHTPKIFIPSNLSFQVWNAVTIDASFILFEGIEIMGNSANISHEDAYQSWVDYENNVKDWNKIASFNVNGISIGKDADVTNVIVRGCEIHHMPGGGVGGGRIDYITIEDNLVYNNSWRTMYATSGISILTSYNSDESTDYKILVRNNSSFGNKTLVPWNHIDKLSDGNGIIIDVNTGYVGRTLVENNISYNNGGSGIHAYKSSHVDIINNTAYNNGTVVGYQEIFGHAGTDVRIYNNIMYARNGGACNMNATGTTYDYNLYFNGPAPKMGTNDLVADPKFVKLALDGTADFKLRNTSPAINSGTDAAGKFSTTDINGVTRPVGSKPDRGAYESPFTEIAVVAEMVLKENANIILPGTETNVFGDVFYDNPKTVTFTIENKGGADLQLTGSPRVAITGSGFALAEDAPATIGAGNSATFKVTLSTNAEIQYSGTINIANNDAYANPYVVTISGKGLNSAKAVQTIMFNALPAKNIQSEDFNPGAVSNLGLPVTYASSKTTVATIVNGKIHIVGIGTSIITASQGGNSDTHPAAEVKQTLSVISVLNLSETNLINNPSFDSNTSGWSTSFQNSATATSASVDKIGYASKVGNVSITSGGTSSSPYNVQFGCNVSVVADKEYAILFKASADDARTMSIFMLKNQSPWSTMFSENNISLTTIPETYGPFYYNSTTTESLVFRLLLGVSVNAVYIDDVEIREVLPGTTSAGKNIFNAEQSFSVYPNPAKNKIHIVTSSSSKGQLDVSLINLQGQMLVKKTFYNTEKESNALQMDVNVNSGVYFLKLSNGEFSEVKSIIIK
jgi:parallel beta-helix repeat protein